MKTCKTSVTGSANGKANTESKGYCTRFVYNKNVRPNVVDALLVKKFGKCDSKATETPRVISRVVLPSRKTAGELGVRVKSPVDKVFDNICEGTTGKLTPVEVTSTHKWAAKVISPPGESVDNITGSVATDKVSTRCDTTAKVISVPRGDAEAGAKVSSNPNGRGSVNSDKANPTKVAINDLNAIYDVKNQGVLDKFVNSILHVNQFSGIIPDVDTEIYHKWREQSDFNFGFVPLGDQKLPDDLEKGSSEGLTPLEMHDIARATNKPNYMEARLPVDSQLKVDAWKRHLGNYWDKQLLQLLEFGFPLDFNRNCLLRHEPGNHKSATEFPRDVDAYIAEELKYDALLGPFDTHPIASGHCSPFMTRAKPNSDRRRVIIDLSWPVGASVNAGIDKTSYLSSPFSLTFPTVDHITTELMRLGRGALLFKVD